MRIYDGTVFAPTERRRFFPSADGDALAWMATVNAAGGAVSGGQIVRVSTLIRSLKSAGVWSSLDRLWLFASENATQALTDLKARAVATAVNSPTFTANQGYAGNGTTSYVDTNFNLSTATNYTQNSAHWSVWRRAASDTAASNANDGALLTVPTRGAWPQFIAGGSEQATVNGSAAATFTSSDNFGSLVASRTGANVCFATYNGVTGVTETTASTALVNLTFWVGARNFNGAVNQAGNHQTMSASMGGGLTAAQAIALHNALSAYKTAVGA